MKKAKVTLIQFCAKLEDGSRKTIQRITICSCDDRGTAELIRYKLADHYSTLTDNKADNMPIWLLTVEY